MFFKHFASKNQLPGFHISGTMVENGLTILKVMRSATDREKFATIFSETSNLDNLGSFFIFKLHNIFLSPTKVKKVVTFLTPLRDIVLTVFQ